MWGFDGGSERSPGASTAKLDKSCSNKGQKSKGKRIFDLRAKVFSYPWLKNLPIVPSCGLWVAGRDKDKDPVASAVPRSVVRYSSGVHKSFFNWELNKDEPDVVARAGDGGALLPSRVNLLNCFNIFNRRERGCGSKNCSSRNRNQERRENHQF